MADTATFSALVVAERKALDALRRKLLGVGSSVSLDAIDRAWAEWRALAAEVRARTKAAA